MAEPAPRMSDAALAQIEALRTSDRLQRIFESDIGRDRRSRPVPALKARRESAAPHQEAHQDRAGGWGGLAFLSSRRGRVLVGLFPVYLASAVLAVEGVRALRPEPERVAFVSAGGPVRAEPAAAPVADPVPEHGAESGAERGAESGAEHAESGAGRGAEMGAQPEAGSGGQPRAEPGNAEPDGVTLARLPGPPERSSMPKPRPLTGATVPAGAAAAKASGDLAKTVEGGERGERLGDRPGEQRRQPEAVQLQAGPAAPDAPLALGGVTTETAEHGEIAGAAAPGVAPARPGELAARPLVATPAELPRVGLVASRVPTGAPAKLAFAPGAGGLAVAGDVRVEPDPGVSEPGASAGAAEAARRPALAADAAEAAGAMDAASRRAADRPLAAKSTEPADVVRRLVATLEATADAPGSMPRPVEGLPEAAPARPAGGAADPAPDHPRVAGAAADEIETIPQATWPPREAARVPVPAPRFARLSEVLAQGGGGRANVESGPRPAATAAPRVQQAASAPAARTGAAPPRIVLHYRRDAGPDAARRMAAELLARGYGRTELRPVSFAISRANVRFFHDQNRPVARKVNELVQATGRRSDLRDFTHYSPLPSVGTVEVWLPG